MSQPHQYEDFTVTLTGTPGSYKLSARGERGLVILDELCDVTALTHPALVATLDTVRAGYAPGAAEMVAVGSALYTTLSFNCYPMEQSTGVCRTGERGDTSAAGSGCR
jgi:hypothetical protein